MANLKSADILAELSATGNLPVIPKTLSDFEEAWADPDVHIDILVNIISQNPEMVMRVINSANSAIYKKNENVHDIASAVSRIGLADARSIVHAVSLHQSFRSAHIEPRHFWRHSVLTAFGARSVADYMRKTFKWDVNPNHAFLAGLVHEVGLVMMWRFFERRYDEVRDQSHSLDEFIENENAMLHMTHSVLGAAILHEWKFPPNIIMAVAGHHHPERLTGDFYKIAYVVCLAEGATWLMDENNGFYPSKPKQISKQLLRHLQLENMTKDELIPLALRAREDAVASGMLSMF